MGKVYHPHHPKEDDGNLSWSLNWAPYFHPKNYSGQISDAPDATFQDGMITDVALQRIQAACVSNALHLLTLNQQHR